MVCRKCGKEIDVGREGYYELWRLAMPAHEIGYMCMGCYDKSYSVRIKKFFSRLWEKIKWVGKTNSPKL